MKKLNILLYLLTVLVVGLSCDKQKPEPNVVLPTDLSSVITVNIGEVNVEVTANKANFYSVTFIQGSDTTFIETADGMASHKFTESGTHTIISRAHVSYEHYIEKVESVEIALLGFVNSPPSSGYETPMTHQGYTLVWNEEFDGSELSSSWVFDIGTGSSGWGNNELQNYTNSNYNISNGLLEIYANTSGSDNYASTRIKTQGLESWQYGRIDVRAALPFGKGIWPAIWMLGDSFQSDGWPYCGEIDIMELIGGEGYNDRTIYGTAHWESNGHAEYGNGKSLPSGTFADEFHVFSIIWDANSIKWLLDDVQYSQLAITAADMSEFHQKFFLILNVAVGGNWPGSPDNSTSFPQSMFIDYIRIFQ